MNSRIQSILARLEGLPDSPVRADILLELAGLYQNSDPSQALVQAERARELSRKLDHGIGLAAATRLKGAIHEQLGDYPRAVSCGMQALVLYREIGDQREAGRCLNNIGLAYTRMGALGAALDHFQRALEILAGDGDDQIRAYVINNIGLTYRSLDNHPRAMEHFQQSLDILERLGDRRSIAHALSNIGLCHRTLGDGRQAMEHMRRSLAIRQEIGDRFSQTHSWINIANLHRDLGEHDQSYDCLMRAMDLAVEGGNTIMEVYVMALLAKLKNVTGELDAALDYIEHALPLAEKLGDQGVLRTLYQEYADNHEAGGRLGKALEYRLRYFQGEVGLLSKNIDGMEDRAAASGQPPADETGRIAAGIRRDQVASLKLKFGNVRREFRQMLEHFAAVADKRPEPDQESCGDAGDEKWLERAIGHLPEPARPALRGMWADIRDIGNKVERLRQRSEQI